MEVRLVIIIADYNGYFNNKMVVRLDKMVLEKFWKDVHDYNIDEKSWNGKIIIKCFIIIINELNS